VEAFMAESTWWQPERFFLWIHGKGGYLICLKEAVVLGHAGGGRKVDVPLLAPVGAEHVRFWRESEGYWIEPIEPVWVDGHLATGPTWLRDGTHIQLAETVRLRFLLPHPCSMTGCLEFLSPHRTEPRSDAILLMGETCLVGPQPNCHIVCPWLPEPVVLFRHQGGLYCRAEGGLLWDGRQCPTQAGPLTAHSQLRTDHLCMAVEAF
jgi:hypothetical protein